MDHQDWPEWAGDESHSDADTADLGHSGDQSSGELGDFSHAMDAPGGFDDGYGLGDEPSPEPGGEPVHPSIGSAPDLTGESGDDPLNQHVPADHGYPEDDPFPHTGYDDPGVHDGVHDDPGAHDGAHDDPGAHDGIDPAAGDDAGHHPGEVHEATDAPEHTPDDLIGTDPDVDPRADDPGWHEPEFPPQLDLDHAPQPVDGYPWSDPTMLGTGAFDDGGHLPGGWSDPAPGDLFDYAGISVPDGADPWQALLGSEDPAAGALARYWAPSG